MMKARSKRAAMRGGTQRLPSGQAVRLGRLGGELTVIDGRIWLTRNHDLGDHFIEPGQRVRLGAGENAVIESALANRGVQLRWSPRRRSFVGAWLAEPLRAASVLADLAARGFTALAHSAAAAARRAQGGYGVHPFDATPIRPLK